jgi:hypothetical protein
MRSTKAGPHAIFISKDVVITPNFNLNHRLIKFKTKRYASHKMGKKGVYITTKPNINPLYYTVI